MRITVTAAFINIGIHYSALNGKGMGDSKFGMMYYEIMVYKGKEKENVGACHFTNDFSVRRV